MLAMTGAARDDGQPTAGMTAERPTRWAAISLIAFILFVAGSIRLIITPLQQAAQLDLGLTDTEIATLKGLALGIPGLFLALPLGIAIDHYNRTRLVVLGAVLWTAGAILTPFAAGFVSLFVARVLIAIGLGAATGAFTSVVADLCPPDKRGRALIIVGIGILAGPALAFAGGGALFGHFRDHGWALFPGVAPWRLTSIVFAVFSVLLMIPVLLLREPVRHERAEQGAGVVGALKGLVIRWRFILPLWIGSTAAGLSEGAAGIWAAPLLTRNYGLQPDQFGGWMGIMILVAGALGSIIGGQLADWGSRSGRRGGVLIGAIGGAAVTIPTAVFSIMPSALGFGLMLGVLMLACTVTQVIVLAAVTTLIPNEERGVCLQATAMAATLVGLGMAPLAPLLAPPVFGDGNHLAAMLAVINVVTGIIGFAGYVVAFRTAPGSWQDA